MKKDIVISIAWAAAMILVALAASFARKQGYIDGYTVLRVVAMNGLFIAWFGNRMPKALAPSGHARQVSRFAGWIFVLSGLTYAGLWAFAPISLAKTVGTGAVALGLILTLGYCFWLRRRARADA